MVKAANPLFLKWVQEFHAEKDYKKKGGPPRPTGYENAVRALQGCSTKYEHPCELKSLTGVGPTCISRLIEKLEAHCDRKGIAMPDPPVKTGRGGGKVQAVKPPVMRMPAPPSTQAFDARQVDWENEAEHSDDEAGSEEENERASVRCANPLFLRWVQEFHDEKDYRKRGGHPRATGYENAIRALESCTVKYQHTKELLKLTGIGQTCVARLTEKLEEHCEENGLEMPEPPAKKGRASTSNSRATPAPKPRKRKNARPDYGSEDEGDDDNDEDYREAGSSKGPPAKKLRTSRRKT